MALKPIKKKRLFEEIIVAIEQYVQEENIQPGEKLPSENELASIFNVSKTAVREAMSVLNANGILETRPGSGIYLKDIHGESIVVRVTSNLMEKGELQEILDFRRGLEVEAAGLAATRGTEEQFAKIRKAHEDMVEANGAGIIGVDEDYNFHEEIILASHNSIYRDIFKAVSPKLKEAMRISKMQSMKTPGLFLQAYQEHEDIMEALFKRDSEGASRAMRHHLIRNEEKIWANLRANISFPHKMV
ncbi:MULTISPECIES: FadR/GntR family transcriptional regulator [Paenibacillus]|uniref:DNA-binding transcriptional repressor LldR n=1 Tax=Paenibacillus naphthalenovorans TaxID=162209 RepID=A0A0U2UIR9_9BACL|nr:MULTISPECIES: FadR/GntR family transcriptional regulator [Paenibacillus]ALS23068.1 DNA-binding transcriptional repressor LldR [Paenibacillus naphthalenovorans]GCL71871.1 FadR family transcriptional regulator [Paenibacillus naphthalenovorans]SDI41215.1 DNA-binding transcriptional regulator, FadR family [Paenibacillus naphthalenovorans]